MTASQLSPLLDLHLLLQLGDRLKRLRMARGLSTVEMAALVNITRNTLRAVESGDPAPSIGTYVRVMQVLGVSGDLALLVGDTLQPPPRGFAAAHPRRERPQVQVRVSADPARHQAQDLQSLALHKEAVRLAKSDPVLVQRAMDTVQRWLSTGDARSSGLWREWEEILSKRAWRKVLGRTRRAQELRQASPLATVLPEDVRQRILAQMRELKAGVVLR